LCAGVDAMPIVAVTAAAAAAAAAASRRRAATATRVFDEEYRISVDRRPS
jgi:hypothetical protein